MADKQQSPTDQSAPISPSPKTEPAKSAIPEHPFDTPENRQIIGQALMKLDELVNTASYLLDHPKVQAVLGHFRKKSAQPKTGENPPNPPTGKIDSTTQKKS